MIYLQIAIYIFIMIVGTVGIIVFNVNYKITSLHSYLNYYKYRLIGIFGVVSLIIGAIGTLKSL